MKLGPELLVKLEKIKVYKCDKCSKMFPSISQLFEHSLHHDELFLSHVLSAYVLVKRAKLFKCEKCTQSFETNRDFMLHKVSHIQNNVRIERKQNRFLNNNIPKPFKCPDCDFHFAAESTLEKHSVLHKPFPHICKCGIGYFKENDLRCHIRLVHRKDTKVEPKLTAVRVVHEKQAVTPKPQSPDTLISKSSKGSKLKEKEKRKPKIKKKIKDDNTKVKRKKNFYNLKLPDINIRVTRDNKHECPECKKLFNSKHNVYTHYRIHTGERPFSCNLCSKSFTQSGSLTLHLERHMATEKKYVCSQCPKAFSLPCYRDRHEIIHSAVKPYDCPYCGKGFHDKSALARHKRIHTGEKRHQCPYCPKKFTDISALRMHKLRHEKNKKYECEKCQKSFYSQSDLRNHMIVHTYERNFVCDYCKKGFSTKYNLKEHMIMYHLAVKKTFKCEKCDKKFFTKIRMLNHLQVHKGIKEKSLKVQCNDCSKVFSYKRKFLQHYLQTHSGIKCDKCSRYFANKSHFKYHKLIESVQCEICDEKFYCENMKEKHFKIHFEKCEGVVKSEADILNEM